MVKNTWWEGDNGYNDQRNENTVAAYLKSFLALHERYREYGLGPQLWVDIRYLLWKLWWNGFTHTRINQFSRFLIDNDGSD